MTIPRPIALLLCGCCALLLAGCPNNGTGTPIADRDAFTQARQDAVRAVVNQVVATAGVVATLHPLADERLNLAGGFGEFGTCPEVRFSSLVTATASATFDYGAGCNAAALGEATVAGEVDLTEFGGSTGATIRLDDVTVDGAVIDGFLQAPAIFDVDANTPVTAVGDIEIDGAGEFEGELRFAFADDGSFVMTSTSTRVTDPTNEDWFVEFEALIVDPARWGTFVPEDGTLIFRDDSLVPITVRFTERSAEVGIVQVTVRNGSAQNFNIFP